MTNDQYARELIENCANPQAVIDKIEFDKLPYHQQFVPEVTVLNIDGQQLELKCSNCGRPLECEIKDNQLLINICDKCSYDIYTDS